MKPFFLRHKEDKGVDEITLKVQERYKTSGMSGDEWRFNYKIQFKYKGLVLKEVVYNGLEFSAGSIPYHLGILREQGEFPWEEESKLFAQKCCQPGCQNDAVSEYRLKATYSSEGDKKEPSGEYMRRFCKRHLTRGDCALEDSDSNYEVVSGPGPKDTDWKEANITESAQVTIQVDSVDQVGAAVANTLKNLNRENV